MGTHRAGVVVRIVGAHIASYRGISDLSVPLRGATALLGGNGAGKSSILEALGYSTTEDGAMPRRRDAAPSTSWFFADDSFGDELVLALTGGRADLREVVSRIEAFLVVHAQHSGPTVAFDVHGCLESVPSRRRTQARIDLIDALGTIDDPPPWVSTLITSMEDEECPAIVRLRVPCEARTPLSPHVVSMVVDPDDVSPLLYRHAVSILRAWLGGGPDVPTWAHEVIAAADNGLLAPAHERGVLAPVIAMIGTVTTALLPPFVASRGQIRIGVLDGPDGTIGEVERLLATAADTADAATRSAIDQARQHLRTLSDTLDLHLEAILHPDAQAEGHPYAALGTGIRKWVSGTIDEAARLMSFALTEGHLPEEDRRASIEDRAFPFDAAALLDIRHTACDGRPRLRLVDEPVANLEPRLHPQVLRWLRRVQREHETLVFSTHQVSIVRGSTTNDDFAVVGVWRSSDRVKVEPLGRQLVHSLYRRRSSLNLATPDILFSARAVLAVEGPTDIEVLEAIYGDDLAERGVVFMMINTSSSPAVARAITNTVYRRLRLPTWVILDGTRDHTLKVAHWAPATENKDKVVAAARHLLAEDGLGGLIHQVPFEPIDILGGIEPDVLRIAFPKGKVPEDALEQMRTRQNSERMKNLLTRWSGESLTAPKITARVVAAINAHITPPHTAANVYLRTTMERFFTEVDRELGR